MLERNGEEMKEHKEDKKEEQQEEEGDVFQISYHWSWSLLILTLVAVTSDTKSVSPQRTLPAMAHTTLPPPDTHLNNQRKSHHEDELIDAAFVHQFPRTC